MSDDYDRYELDHMPIGTVLTDDESGDRLTKTEDGWYCDGCWITHSSRTMQFRRFSEVTYPEIPRPEPAEQPQSDEKLQAVLKRAESWELQATCEGTINPVWAEAIKHCAADLRRAIEEATP